MLFTKKDKEVIVPVNRGLTPAEAIEEVKHKKLVDPGVLARLPQGSGEKARVVLFKMGRDASDPEVRAEYATRGLEMDPRATLAYKILHPKDERPFATPFGDANDSLKLGWWLGEPSVFVHPETILWVDRWVFVGVRPGA